MAVRGFPRLWCVVALLAAASASGDHETGDCVFEYEKPQLSFETGGRSATVTWANTGVTLSHDDESRAALNDQHEYDLAEPCNFVSDGLTKLSPGDTDRWIIFHYYHRRQVRDGVASQKPPAAGSGGPIESDLWRCVAPDPDDNMEPSGAFGETGQEAIDLTLVPDNPHLEIYPHSEPAQDLCRERTSNAMRTTGLEEKVLYDVYVGTGFVPKHHRSNDQLVTNRAPFSKHASVRVYAQSTPGRPPDLEVVGAREDRLAFSGGDVRLKWGEAFNWTTPKSNLTYEYRLRELVVGGEVEAEWPDVWTASENGGADREARIAGLRVGSTYQIQVRGKNSIGGGDEALVRVTLLDMPVMRRVSAQSIGDGVGKVRLEWELLDDGGDDIDDYEYRYIRIAPDADCAATAIPADHPWTSVGRALGVDLDGLGSGVEYRFEARAVNPLASEPVSTCFPVGRVPYAPTLEVELIERGLVVHWQPAADGGFDVIAYEYFFAPVAEVDIPGYPDEAPPDDDGRWQTACGSATVGGKTTLAAGCEFEITVTNLEFATEYTFLMRGENIKGKGSGRILNFTTSAGVPAAPEELQAEALDGAVELSWVAGDDNGEEIRGYEVRYRDTRDMGDKDAWGPWRFVGEESPVVVPGLTNGVKYEFELRAYSGAGLGDVSDVEATPEIGDALRAVVRNLEAEEGACVEASGRETCTVTLTWDPPRGATPVRYEWSRGDGTWRAIAATNTMQVVKGLSGGATHSLFVRTVTERGGTGPPVPVRVTPGTLPPVVTGLTATAEDGAVELAWSAAERGNALSYEYRYQSPGGAWSAWVSVGFSLAATVRELTNGVEYTFEVRAVSLKGSGMPASEKATPAVGVSPGVPGNLVVDVGDGSVRLAWRQAVASDGSEVDGYLCRYRAQGGASWRPCTEETVLEDGTVAPPGEISAGDNTVLVTDLTNGVTYEFEVRSRLELRQSEPSRGEATPVAAGGAAGAPQALVAQVGDGRATLRWESAATGDGAAVTLYQYRLRRVGGAFGNWQDACRHPPGDQQRVRCGEVVEWTVESLANGTRFHIELRALKGGVPGPAASVWVTPAGVPQAPLDLTHTVTDGDLRVAWRPPADGGSAILRYEYRLRQSGGEFGDWLPAADRLVEAGDRYAMLLTGLRSDIAYEVEVRAVNEIGEGPAAGLGSTVGAVGGGPLSAVAGDGEVELRWRETSESDIVRYEYRCIPEVSGCVGWVDARDLIRIEGTELVLRITGLANGTDYTFEVRAVDGDRVGAVDVVRATPAAPPAPPNLTVRAGDGEVTLSWQPPDVDGGAAVVRYEYRWNAAGGEFGPWHSAGRNALVTVGGLDNGIEHIFAVRAVNSAGEGRAATAAATPAGSPAAPVDLVVSRGDRSVNLRWDPPGDDGGVAVRGYEYRYRRADETRFVAWTSVGAATQATVGGLDNGVEYIFEVRAANAAFSGVAAVASATPGGAPGAPRALAAEAGDGQVVLRWEAPESDGGLGVDGYELRWSGPEQAPGAWTDNGAERIAVVEGLTNGLTYVFEVRAVNLEGGGTVASVVARPWVASAPGAPVLTARADSRRVSLSWTVPDNGGEAIARYEHRWRIDGEAFGAWVEAGLSTGVVVEGLDNGVAYVFEVRAVNAIGAGDAGMASATPAGLPGEPALTVRAGPEEAILSWAAPEDDGGLSILRYEYRWREQAGTFTGWRDAGLDRSATARGLLNGITYLFEVRAVNAKGAGEAARASAIPVSGVADAVLAESWMARLGRMSSSHIVDALQDRFAEAPRRWSPSRSPRTRAPDDRVPAERPTPSSERVRHRGGVGGRGSNWQAGSGFDGGWWTPDAEHDAGTSPGEAARRTSAGGSRGVRALARALVREYLPGDSFLLSAAPTAGATRVSAWGRFTTGGFDGTDALASVEGRARTWTLGADVERASLLAGLAVSHTAADGGFELAGEGGAPSRRGDDVVSSLTGFYPYLRVSGDRLSLWGVGGSAQGSLALTGSGVDVDADLAGGMGGLGVRGVWLAAGAFEIAVKSDLMRSWLTASGPRLDEVDAAVNRFRMLLEASGSSPLAAGVLTSTLEVGLRHDSGSAEGGGGVELGGRLRFAGGRRLTLSAEGRALVAHGEEGFGEWGLSGSVLYAPRPTGAGASLRLMPAWGTSTSSVERLWAEPEHWLTRHRGPAFGIDAEYGYGFAARRGDAVAGPFLAVGYRRGAWVRRTGWRLEGHPLRASAVLLHRESPLDGRGGPGILLRATVRF